MLGIQLERIRPAHPEENGRHERMHRTLKSETAMPARTNLLQQQDCFDAFQLEYNEQRPHEALGQRCPAELFKPSARACPRTLPIPRYAGYDDVVKVNTNGCVYMKRARQVYVSSALAGLYVGLDSRPDGRWLVSFVHLDLGYIDADFRKFSPLT